MSTSVHPSEELAQTMRRIYELGLTTTSGGNLSLRDAAGTIWITPAGIDKGQLRADQVARVAEGGVAEATPTPAPSSELPFHRAIYEARPELRAVVHAHPVSLVAFSIVGQVPDTRISAHCHALCGSAGFAPYALPASQALGETIAETFAQGFDCVVLENHGVVVGGPTLRVAFERLEALDLCARTIMRARSIGEAELLSAEDLALAGEVAPATAAPTAQTLEGDWADTENGLRQSICALARRAHDRRVFTSTQGVLSARLSPGAFLMTPRWVPLDRLEPGDLLRVEGGKLAAGDRDSTGALHEALYRRHPEVSAIAHGHGENTSGFATAGMPLPARTIPESYILVREPGFVSLREFLVEPTSVAEVLNPDHPVALVGHAGAMALGASLLDAFDRLEVLEATAAALIASRTLGEFAPMTDEQLVELRRTFFPGGGIQGALNRDGP